VAIPCGGCSDRGPACHGDLVLGDVQYPTLWLPVALIAAVVVGAVGWRGERFTRVVVAIALIALVILGYLVLPQVLDVDQLMLARAAPSAADDHRVEKQVTFVDEIGFERKPRKLGAANADVVLRFPLELPNSLEAEVPLDMRIACRSATQRS
jgi:hypothetical protein